VEVLDEVELEVLDEVELEVDVLDEVEVEVLDEVEVEVEVLDEVELELDELVVQTLLVQVWLVPQVPQKRSPPQPLLKVPQFRPVGQVASGIQPELEVELDDEVELEVELDEEVELEVELDDEVELVLEELELEETPQGALHGPVTQATQAL
jgi:hypothetical protein